MYAACSASRGWIVESRESVPLHAAQKEVEEAPVRNSGVESRKSKLGRHARVLVGAPGASPSPPRALAFALSLSHPRVRPRRQSSNGMQSSLAALVAFANTIRTFYRLSTIYSSRRPGGARPACCARRTRTFERVVAQTAGPLSCPLIMQFAAI